MLRGIIRHPPHMRLHHMLTIQVRHFTVGFNPDLVLRERRNVIEGGNVEFELSSLLGKLSEAGADAEKLVARNRGCEFSDGFTDVVDSLTLETEYVRIVGAVNKLRDVAADVRGELFEETFGLLVGERAHFVGCGVFLKAGT